jgi:hypothetical protein
MTKEALLAPKPNNKQTSKHLDFYPVPLFLSGGATKHNKADQPSKHTPNRASIQQLNNNQNPLKSHHLKTSPASPPTPPAEQPHQ